MWIHIYRPKRKELPVNSKPHCHTHKKSPGHTLMQRRKITVSETPNHSNARARAHTHKQTNNDKYQRGVKQTKINTLKEKGRITSL